MSKSLAETVNFAQAVQTKAYEKKAQQVDTFVQSESAEQKLARSSKFQTAKAIEALSKLSGNVLEGEAKKREEEVQLLQQDLQNITARAVQEAREGKAPYTSETFANLPIRMQTQVRNAIGYDKAKRKITEATAGVDSFMLLDSDALAAHLDQYREGKAVLSAMDAHEMLGYENAWQAGVDILNNKAIEAKTAQGEEEVQATFKTNLAQIISVEDTIHQNAMESGVYAEKMEGMTSEQQDDFMKLVNKQTVKNTVAKVEAHFNSYPTDVGIDIPPKILKTWTREALIDAATATGNPFFLHPENFGNTNFQDAVSTWAFTKARRAFDDKLESDRNTQTAAANQQEQADLRTAREAVVAGTLNEGNATTWVEKEVVKNYNQSSRVPSPQSNTAMLTLQDSIREGVTKTGATHLLLKNKQGEFVPAIHPITEKPVELNKEAIWDYIEHLPTMLTGHKLTLQNNLDGLMVGITSSSTYPTAETTKFFTGWLDGAVDDRRAATLLPQLELEAKRKWHGLYLQAMEDNKYKPLKELQLLTLQEGFNTWKEDRVSSITITPTSNVTLDGQVKTTEEPVPEPVPEYDGTWGTLPETHKTKWEEIKNDPKLVEQWQADGLPVSPTYSQEQPVVDRVVDSATPPLTDGVADTEYSVTLKRETDWMGREEASANRTQAQADRFIARMDEKVSEIYDWANETLGFDRETAKFGLTPKQTEALEAKIHERYTEKTRSGRGHLRAAPDHNEVMKIVLKELGITIEKNRNFKYKGENARTAGEVAVKRLVDSLMAKYESDK